MDIRSLAEAYAAVYDETLREELLQGQEELDEDFSFIDELTDDELDLVIEQVIFDGSITLDECFESLNYLLLDEGYFSKDERRERTKKSREKAVRMGRIAQAVGRVGDKLASAARGSSSPKKSVSQRVADASSKVGKASEKVKKAVKKGKKAVEAGAEAAKGAVKTGVRAAKAGYKAAAAEISGEAGRESEARKQERKARRAERRKAADERAKDTSAFKTPEKPKDPWGEPKKPVRQAPKVTTTSTKALPGTTPRAALPPAKESDRVAKAKKTLADKAAGTKAGGVRFATSKQLAPKRAHTGKKEALAAFRKKVGLSDDFNYILDVICEGLISEGYVETYNEALYVLESLHESEFEEVLESYLVEEAEAYEADQAIIEYLLDEGYANSVDHAETIMINMSEEWRESILG